MYNTNAVFTTNQNITSLTKILLLIAEHLTSIYEVDSQMDFGLQVIGVGLMRSGTTSLKFALEYLYKKRCYHMRELVLNIREPHIKLWLWAIKQDREKKEIPKQFWSYIYNDFVAAVDYPTAGFYKHLSKIYPNAKVSCL